MVKRIVQRLWSPRLQAPLIIAALLLALWSSGSVGANSQGAPAAPESPPAVLNYQGVVKVDGELFDGTGHCKFAIVDAAGGDGSTNFWANDGTASGEPGAGVPLPVSDGLFNVLLGDTDLDGMSQPIEASVFAGDTAYLRVWFSPSGITGSYEALEPNQRIASVAYALRAKYAENGPPGPTGATGPAGPAGATGATGPQGPGGAQGMTGATGASGPQGVQGPSGPAGPDGTTGPAGPVGATGPQGIQGPSGPAGSTGPSGPSGPQGSIGPTGQAGRLEPLDPQARPARRVLRVRPICAAIARAARGRA